MASEPKPRKVERSRTEARAGALRALYQMELAHGNPQQALEVILEDTTYAPEGEEFVRQLVVGAATHLQAIDAQIEPHLAAGWTLGRLSVVDRNILRLAAFELWHCPQIPPKVTINEAIVLADRYGSADSKRYINGVLGSLLLDSPKSSWDPAQASGDASFTSGEGPDATPEEQAEIEQVIEGSPEYEVLVNAGPWTVRTSDQGASES